VKTRLKLNLLNSLIIGYLATAFVSVARGDSEIVIAIRYLEAAGVSHSHLYLYREDGRLLRQLTTTILDRMSNRFSRPMERPSCSLARRAMTNTRLGALSRARPT
jgi:hypothetical protein